MYLFRWLNGRDSSCHNSFASVSGTCWMTLTWPLACSRGRKTYGPCPRPSTCPPRPSPRTPVNSPGTCWTVWNTYRWVLIVANLIDLLICTNSQSLQDLLTQCRQSPYPYVLCSHFLLKKPGGQLVRTLTGHNSAIDSLDLHQYPEGKLVALTGNG